MVRSQKSLTLQVQIHETSYVRPGFQAVDSSSYVRKPPNPGVITGLELRNEQVEHFRRKAARNQSRSRRNRGHQARHTRCGSG